MVTKCEGTTNRRGFLAKCLSLAGGASASRPCWRGAMGLGRAIRCELRSTILLLSGASVGESMIGLKGPLRDEDFPDAVLGFVDRPHQL